MLDKELLKNSTEETKVSAKSDHFIVAIGASAGGLEAIHEFFDNMPENSSLSFIVIQHLSPDYKSLLVELVSKHTHMKVYEAVNDMKVHKECIYIIPNKKLMTIKDGKLRLTEKIEKKAPNTAIDYFLNTLAGDQKEKAIAIILSGTGTDGTRGIEAIKQSGGMVIVQDPVTAKFDGMPNSAITSGNADFILPPEMMPEEIYNHIHENPVHVLNKGKIDDGLLTEIFSLIYKTNGYDFHYYKSPTIIRRIGKRMGQKGFSKLNEYADHLHKNPDEVNRLSKDFLIGVTKFFRDQPAFESLYKDVLPRIVREKGDNSIFKIWICACSTGEEAYSIAILIDKYLQKTTRSLDVKIFATDIDESNIEFAARNIYPDTIEKDIDEKTLDQYFIKDGKNYSIIPRIRKQIVFARHNVIKDPPFIKNDLVSCRNMLIYMNSVLQQKVLSTLHFSLNMEGYLFLGPSETIASIKESVYEVNSKWKIFRKIGNNKTQPHEIYRPFDGNKSFPRQAIGFPKIEKSKISTLTQEFSDSMMEDFGYVGFYIDTNFEIKETAGDYNKFLSLPEKKLNLNILKMVPQELSVALNTAVRRSWKEERKIFLKSVRVKSNDTDLFVSISVTPPKPLEGKPNTLIILGEHFQSQIHHKEDSNILSSAEQNQYVAELELELTEARSNLQMAIEGLETTNEELQSSNEELLSANEELQSSNEELQSLNEELHTLNTEHQLKIKELIELNDDLNNFFRSTDIGQIFLDSDLRIRKFNSAAVNMINLIETDTGRPINHISTNIRYENLLKDIHQVLKTGETVEREVILQNDNRCLMRILPYIKQDKTLDGAIITFVDISAIENLNNIINGVFNSSLNAIVAFKAIRNRKNKIADFELQTANYSSELLFNIDGQTTGKKLSSVPLISKNGFIEKYIDVVTTGETLHTEINIIENNVEKWFEVVAVKMMDGFVATFSDITDKRLAELRLKSNYNELIQVRENLKKTNSRLEEKVKERTKELFESEERFRLVARATNDAIWDWSLVDNSIWWSESFYKIFQYEVDPEVQKRTFWDSKIHPDDRERVQESIIAAINNHEEQWHEEYRFLKADGTYSIILDRGRVLQDEFGTPYRMLGSMLDISSLKEAEQKIINSESKFRKVFESNMVGMLFTKADGLIISANDAFLDMLGYTREDLDNGKITWQNITPAGFLEKNAWAREQLNTKGVISAFENEYVRKDGKRISVLLGAASVNEQDAVAVTYVIDISDKKAAEAKEQRLQKIITNQQEEFKSIFMNAPALISIRRGSNLKIEFINKAVTDYFGRNDLQDKAIEKLDDFTIENNEADELIKEVYKTGKPYFGKAFHLKVDRRREGKSEDVWFDFVYQPVLDIDGNIDGVATFAFDVSDMIRANQEIKRNEERFRFLANAIPQKLWTALPDGSLNYFNIIFLDYTGKTVEEMTSSGWESIVHEEDKARNKEVWQRAITTGEVFEIERRLLSANGTYRWHLSRAVPQFDENGIISMWVGTSTDIDEQKNVSEALRVSEDYFRQLSDQAPFMIWKVDAKGLCNYVNQQWIQCTGLSFNDSLNLGWGQAFHPDDAKREYKKFMEAFNTRTAYHSKFRVKFVDEEYHWVLAQSNAIESDVFEGYIGSLTDITEQETAQDALKLLMQKKDEFMSIASHELKTPITSMKGSLQIAARLTRRNANIDEIHAFIEKANKQVNRLTGLVDDLLDVTKITAGRLEFHPSEFAIGEAIQDCLDQIENNIIGHKIIVEGDKSIKVKADMHRLEQVITNFLSNAIKYSPEADEVVLSISKEHKMLKVSVTDFGIGIPSDKKNFVFDRFFRVQESSAKFSGLGLGLFISAEIIKRHGGKVGVISEENKGSTFWFSLPL
ncbi:PAS domain S-box protein [Pedobacter sp. P351]|uniref:PAS domain S-box protein n=1 Tax=Pedobacter superstes TaxID=3133441 RepID=UPI0030B59834